MRLEAHNQVSILNCHTELQAWALPTQSENKLLWSPGADGELGLPGAVTAGNGPYAGCSPDPAQEGSPP